MAIDLKLGILTQMTGCPSNRHEASVRRKIVVGEVDDPGRGHLSIIDLLGPFLTVPTRKCYGATSEALRVNELPDSFLGRF